jgi:LCP family protein required for cell wall assembly
MFERFDDPAAFRPDAGFRAGVHRRANALRRRRRVLTAGAASLAVVALVGGAGLYVERRDDAIDRIEVTTEPSTDGATNVLLIGTDGPLAEGARADSIAILRFDGSGTRLLSIPRDLYDAEADTRVNQVAASEGAQGVIDAVGRSTGVPIDHYVAIDPAGFVDLVDATGGLRLAVVGGTTYLDESTGLLLSPTDCGIFDGETALALARSRHLERSVDGGWEPDPTGDFGRVARQQVMLGAALDQLDRDPATVERLSRLLADHAVVDSGLDLPALIRLGTDLAEGPTLEVETLPVDQATVNGAAVLELAPGAEAVLSRFGAQPGSFSIDPGPRPTPLPGGFEVIAPCPSG